MALMLLNQDDVVRFQGHRWWAERGMIHCERLNDGSYESMTVRQALLRLKAINDMVTNSLSDRHATGQKLLYSDEIREHQQFIDKMVGLIKKAQDQGRPDDPKAVKQKLQDNRRVRVSMSRRHTF
jgi:hypothetical protein